MDESKLYEIPIDLFIEAGLQPGSATARSFRCEDSDAVPVPVSKIRGPVIAPGRRGLDKYRLGAIIAGIAAGSPMPPVPVYWENAEVKAVLLDGAHRFAVSIAYGFAEIPCRSVTLEEARDSYGYPEGQR